MRRRLTCLILALVFVLCAAAPAAAYSSFEEYLAATGRIKYVDYTRILQFGRKTVKLSFNIGSRTFRGILSHGKNLDNETTDGIIKSVLAEMNLRARDLFVHETRIRTAEARDPAFKAVFWMEMVGRLLNQGTAMDAMHLKESDNGIQFLVTHLPEDFGIAPSLGGMAAEGAALGPVGAFIMNGLVNCTQPMAKECLKAVANDAYKQEALESSAILAAFYGRCNQRLKEEAKKKGGDGWILKASGREHEIRSFFGAPVVQRWTFRCDMKKDLEKSKLLTDQDKVDPNAAGGFYTGVITLDITHDMTRYDANFLWKVADTLPVLPQIHEKYPSQSFYDCWKKKSILEKHLYAQKISIVIPDNIEKCATGDRVDTLRMETLFRMKDVFWSLHPIWMVPDGVLPMLDEKGRYSFTGAQGQMATILYITGEMDDHVNPTLELLSSNSQLWQKVDVPHYHQEWDQSQEGGSGSLAYNTDIFEDLKSGEILVTAGWKE